MRERFPILAREPKRADLLNSGSVACDDCSILVWVSHLQTAADDRSAPPGELTETNDSLSTAGDELRTQQGLLDAAGETWEKLIPGCIADPGMSYEERVRQSSSRRKGSIQGGQ